MVCCHLVAAVSRRACPSGVPSQALSYFALEARNFPRDSHLKGHNPGQVADHVSDPDSPVVDKVEDPYQGRPLEVYHHIRPREAAASVHEVVPYRFYPEEVSGRLIYPYLPFDVTDRAACRSSVDCPEKRDIGYHRRSHCLLGSWDPSEVFECLKR